MHSWVQLTAASRATTAATAAAKWRPAGPPVTSSSGVSAGASQAVAASQAAAAACSAAVSIRAHRCLTAWNWPMGRPNWCRILACSAAVCTAQPAMPHASAANSTAVRLVTSLRVSPGRTRPAGTATRVARTAASGRVGSRLSSPVMARSAASTTAHRSCVPVSTGSTTRSARPAPRTGTDSPSRMRPPPVAVPVSPGASATAADRDPSASPASSLRVSPSAGRAAASSAPASAVGRNPPGAKACPSSSRATASSLRP